jgi:hypothetical protein
MKAKKGFLSRKANDALVRTKSRTSSERLIPPSMLCGTHCFEFIDFLQNSAEVGRR